MRFRNVACCTAGRLPSPRGLPRGEGQGEGPSCRVRAIASAPSRPKAPQPEPASVNRRCHSRNARCCSTGHPRARSSNRTVPSTRSPDGTGTRCSTPPIWRTPSGAPSPRRPAQPAPAALLAPIGSQEVWAAGVTYWRSRDARMEESSPGGRRQLLRPGVRGRAPRAVHEGHRPPGGGTGRPPAPAPRRPLDRARARAGAGRQPPRPDRRLHHRQRSVLPLHRGGKPALPAAGQDLRRLRRAGPGPAGHLPPPAPRDGDPARASAARAARSSPAPPPCPRCAGRPPSLVEFLFREASFPTGCFLFTGTGIVPPDDFTLQAGDEIRIGMPPDRHAGEHRGLTRSISGRWRRDLGRPRDLPHSSALVVLHRLDQLLPGVHHEGAVAGHRLGDGDPGQQQQPGRRGPTPDRAGGPARPRPAGRAARPSPVSPRSPTRAAPSNR